MLFLWASSAVPFGVYFIAQRGGVALQVQPQIFGFFSFIGWFQCLYYPPIQRPMKYCLTLVGCTVVLAVCVEVGLAIGFRYLYDRGHTWPNLMIGIIASVLLAAGLLPPYYELWKRGGQVVGINFLFLSLDSLGALFSFLSLLFQKGTFDVLGCVLYLIVLGLEVGIMSSHIIWLLRTRKQRKLQKEMTVANEGEEGPKEALEAEGTDISESLTATDDVKKDTEAVENAAVENAAVEDTGAVKRDVATQV
ncbi:putative membrane protein [Yarrowia sp. C11]|nr:putative membrane protein [Yarrowia sp. E02]KAG5373205.1 putative membrane protein [Yarrowia sp. C11]